MSTDPGLFPESLTGFYSIEALVGQGAFSTVWKAVHRTSGQLRAVKKIDTTLLLPREIAHEIAIMRLLRHENVVRCYDVFIEGQFVNVVVDMFNGGDLVDGLNAHRRAFGRVPNNQLARLAKQMMSAVAHVHGLCIIHRDVKGENFLADRPDIGDPAVKVALADFGTAMRLERGEMVYSRVGTPAFWAPEIHHGGYDFPVDVWAVGVTTYILMTGALPYEGKDQVCKAQVGANEPPDFNIPFYCTNFCQKFLQQTLQKEPAVRPTARDAAKHPWLTQKSDHVSPRNACSRDEEVVSSKLAEIMNWVFSVVGGLTVSFCSALGYCLCDQSEAEGAAARWSSKATSKASTSGSLICIADKDILEKHTTDLSKQISTHLMEHQDSMRQH